MDGDGVGAPGLEHRMRVRLGGTAHITTLGIEDDRAVFGQCGQRLVEQPAGLPPPSLIERQVELVRRDRIADRLDGGADEPGDARRRPFDRWWQQVRFGVEAEAEERAGGVLAGLQF